MFDGEYSKKVWIISIILAIGCVLMDVFIMLDEDSFMKDMVWITLPVSVFILYKSVQGLIKKIKEEKEGK